MSGQPKILCIETSGGFGTVAIDAAGRTLRAAIDSPRRQTEELLAHIDALLADAGIAAGELDAIGFSSGPGSFIGVRLAASVAQGLATATGVGLAPVSSMAALAGRALLDRDAGGGTYARVLVCLDARMGEVYWADYAPDSGRGLPTTAGERLLRPEAVEWGEAAGGLAVGSGFAEYPALAAAAAQRGFTVDASRQLVAEDLLPFARVALESAQLVSPDRWRIEYLRDETAWRALQR